jgi:Flp pilus assembly protein TadB
MTGPWLAGAVTGVLVLLLVRPRPGPMSAAPPVARAGERDDWLRRWRWPLSGLAGLAAWTFVGATPGVVAGLAASAACWRAIARTEPAGVRREREQLQRELPHVARLLAAALSSGSAPVEAVQAVADALPGPAGARLAGAAARLRLGADPTGVWHGLAAEPALAPLGHALARGHATGASVVASVERLGEELARAARADVEDRARRVGVRAAVPLGVCLLPAFLLIGIVPLVGGLLGSLQL